MRKRQQQQILDLLQTIKQAQTAGLYAECQEGARSAGEFIEGIEGEGTRAVAQIEEYCELLYGAHKGEIGGKRLRKQLIEIENSVRSELVPNRIEVAFLSYNASMSDSIESVYLAAKADPVCDAFWVPVPYYERRPDGSLGSMRCEGADCYGADIVCTDWREYDIKARRPDVIFTFNPYDGGNLVTSIHPDFYCERLRSLTDILVYVPYFVNDDDAVPEHFCTLAGCVFAHKVILQSEEVRNVYIRVFKKAYGNRFGKPEDKFVALDSPKFDKVTNAKRTDFTLPQTWKHVIEGKKAIFFNTSIGALLAGNEQYLKKLRHVLDIFKTRDDVALWWRPHPLNEATYSSMRPQFLAEYRRIVADYRHAGWGIYDDTADLHRAITWTDAYYGDASSVAALYKATRKPVMILDFHHLFPTQGYSVFGIHLHDIGNSIVFSADNSCCIFSIDKESLSVKCICRVPGESDLKQYLFRDSVRICNDLYFAPGRSNYILKLNLCDYSLSKTELPSDLCNDNISKFNQIIQYGNKIILLGYQVPCIAIYDTANNEFQIADDWLSCFPRTQSNDTVVYWERCIVVGNEMIAVSRMSNLLLIFNLDSFTSSCCNVGYDDARFSDICYDGDSFWLVPYGNGKIVRWNRRNNIWSAIGDTVGYMIRAVYFQSYVWVFPCHGGSVLKINVQRCLFEIVFDLQNIVDLPTSFSPTNFIAVIQYDEKFLTISKKSPLLAEYNTATSKTRTSMLILDDFTPEYKLDFSRSIVESDAFNLSKFLDSVICFQTQTDNSKHELSGQRIIEMIKAELAVKIS
jgi:hypothetical protein